MLGSESNSPAPSFHILVVLFQKYSFGTKQYVTVIENHPRPSQVRESTCSSSSSTVARACPSLVYIGCLDSAGKVPGKQRSRSDKGSVKGLSIWSVGRVLFLEKRLCRAVNTAGWMLVVGAALIPDMGSFYTLSSNLWVTPRIRSQGVGTYQGTEEKLARSLTGPQS